MFTRDLRRCLAGALLCGEMADHAFKIGITGAKTSSEPVPTALGNSFAVGDYVELAGLARGTNGVNVEALLDEGHETRDLGTVVLSRRTVNDFDLHCVLYSNLATREAASLCGNAACSILVSDGELGWALGAPSPVFRKDVIPWELGGGVCKRCDSKGFTGTRGGDESRKGHPP